jgi:hypothetical protein
VPILDRGALMIAGPVFGEQVNWDSRHPFGGYYLLFSANSSGGILSSLSDSRDCLRINLVDEYDVESQLSCYFAAGHSSPSTYRRKASRRTGRRSRRHSFLSAQERSLRLNVQSWRRTCVAIIRVTTVDESQQLAVRDFVVSTVHGFLSWFYVPRQWLAH